MPTSGHSPELTLSFPRTSLLKVANTVQGTPKLVKFLEAVVPDEVPYDKLGTKMQTREEFIKDVLEGIAAATMAIRIT